MFLTRSERLDPTTHSCVLIPAVPSAMEACGDTGYGGCPRAGMGSWAHTGSPTVQGVMATCPGVCRQPGVQAGGVRCLQEAV